MRKKQSLEQELLEKLRPQPSFIHQVEERLKRDDLWGINIGSLEGYFLQWLIRSSSVEKIVEIGTQYGCSTLWMAQALGPEGCIYTLEKNAKHIEQAQVTFSQEENKELAKKIHLVTGDAAESLKSIEQWAPFDLVFIDANKNGYLDYYLWAKQFLKSGGYIVADNVYLFGTMFQDSPPEQSSQKMWTKMKHFLSEVFSDPDFDSTFIPTTEGLLVATKK